MSNLLLVSIVQNISNRHQALVSVTGLLQGAITITVWPNCLMADLKVLHHQSKFRSTALCWLLAKRSNQITTSSLYLKWSKIASTTSRNMYFHAWDINTVAVSTAGWDCARRNSQYDDLKARVGGLTNLSQTSFVVRPESWSLPPQELMNSVANDSLTPSLGKGRVPVVDASKDKIFDASTNAPAPIFTINTQNI